MTVLTPLGALAALAALLPLGAVVLGRGRVGRVRRRLGLDPPSRAGLARLAAAVGAIALLGLAAAQPALTSESHARERTDVAALFVLDNSRSMAAAATAASPTRLDRAVAAAVRLRAAIPEVPAGVATLSDRVLPDLLPVPDVAGFDAVVQRAVAVESPPPSATAVRATTYAALSDIASGDYFGPSVTRRVIVLLTDGESDPFDPGKLARELAARQGYRLLAVRFWGQNEAVYDNNGKPEAGYHPDPTGRALLAGLAGAAGGRAFEEGDLGAAASYLRRLAGSGPTVSRALAPGQQPLAPYVAGLAVLLLLLALVRRDRRVSGGPTGFELATSRPHRRGGRLDPARGQLSRWSEP
jgi:hypothetical protein